MAAPYPWQSTVWNHLQSAKMAGRLPHALLFTGVEGVGKRALAEQFAASLFCRDPATDGTPCYRCKACLLLKAGTHPDYRLLAPEEAGKEIVVDSIRACIEKIGLSSQLDGYKVVIIDPAEAMNLSAANSLLKTLEEPVPWTLIILLSAHPTRLQATIRSRCQQIVVGSGTHQETGEWLASQGVGQQAELLLALSGGAPLRALALNQPELLEMRRDSLEAFLGLLEGRGDPLALAERWEKQDPRHLLHWMCGWVVDLIRLRSHPDLPIANSDQQHRLAALAERLHLEALYALLDQLYAGKRDLRGPLNVRLLLEDLLLETLRCAGRSA